MSDLIDKKPETHDKRTEKHACDCISRQAAIDEANAWLLEALGVHKQNRSCGLIRRLEDIQSAQPERKKGRWIDETFEPFSPVFHPYKCNQCGEHSETHSNFCPNCGADMREVYDERPD